MATMISEVTEEQWEQVHKWNRKIVEEFLKQKHLSPQTLRQYESGLKIFFRWVMDEWENKPLYKLKPRHALAYQNWLYEKGLSPSAIKFKRSCVSTLCGYVEVFYSDEEECETFRNIFNKNVPSPSKAKVHEKQPLTKEELQHLIDTLKKRKKWQQVAYIQYTYASGCRRAETRQLLKEVVGYEKHKDKDGNVKEYYYTHPIRCKGKGQEGKVRRLQFDTVAMEAIKKWLQERGEDDCPYVFVSKNLRGKDKDKSQAKATQISASAFNKWCREDFTEIVGRRVHPHMFRSTRATHIVVDNGKDIKSAQALLGHESSQTTEIYVVRDDSGVLDDAF